MAGRLPGFLSGLTDRLAVRILLLLSLALLPLGLIAVHTTAEVLRAARHTSERALIGLTADAVSGKRALIESALASARALGPLAVERLDDVGACRALLADYVERSGVFSFAGFIEPDSWMRCTSMGEAVNLSDRPRFRVAWERPRPFISAENPGTVTGEPVMIVAQPIYANGALSGYLAISINQSSVELMGRVSPAEAPRRAVLFNDAGELVSVDPSINEIARADLSADVDLAALAGQGNTVFPGDTGDGSRATFVVAELIPRSLYVLGTWPEAAAGPTGWRAVVVPMLFPILMWIASLGVLYFAIYHLVIRHVRTLNRQMRRFALGHRDAEAELPHSAPHELRELGGTFRKMTWIIARDEAAREADLAEKTVLLKEVHHRVKNNLQLIASILNLQMRQVQDPGAQSVLQSVQDRVLGLATIHRSLYEEPQLADLQADRVLGEILRQMLSVGIPPGSGIKVGTRIDRLRMDPDRLVPLTLLLAEAVTNALKHISPARDGEAPWLDINLRARDGHAELSIINSTNPGSAPENARVKASTRLGNELIAAFALQLNAELERGACVDPRGSAFALTVRFALADSGGGRPEDAPEEAQAAGSSVASAPAAVPPPAERRERAAHAPR
jgi:two-component sensor histidine kinase